MTALERYLEAATRENTRKSYAQATRHFEEEWGGMLPSTPDAVARYLADFAGKLSNNTLRQRLAALSRWHAQQGFPDPTRSDLVRRTFKGIRALHPKTEKQATPLQIVALERVSLHCEQAAATATRAKDKAAELQALRDRALVLLGFWRGFRSDELVSLQIEHVTLRPGEGVSMFLPRTKGDRQNEGRTFTVPALSRLCPVDALAAWLAAVGQTEGPLFRRITRWGTVGPSAMNADSLVPLLRRVLASAGVEQARTYSSHSLRRGFAGWAASNGWDLKTLMQYVGWRDIQSAARYIDSLSDDRTRIEQGLAQQQSFTKQEPAAVPPPVVVTTLQLVLKLSSYSGKTRGVAPARRHIEEVSLARYSAQPFGRDGSRYQVTFSCGPDDDSLQEQVGELLDELHRIATNNDCYLEATLKDPKSGQTWD